MAEPTLRQEPPGPAQPPFARPPPQPSVAGVALTYEVLRAALDRQRTEADHVTGRATAILGVAGVVLALGTSTADGTDDPNVEPWLRSVLLAVGLALFLAVAAQCYSAWRVRTWRWDPDPLWLWEEMGGADEQSIKYQAVLNMVEAYRHNEPLIQERFTAVRWATRLLVVEVAYVFTATTVISLLD